MKKILFTTLCIGAAAAAVPFVSGMIAERIGRQMVDDINLMYQEMGSDMKLEITDYVRGYADSRVQWRLDLGFMGAMLPMKDIRFVDEMKHGFTAVTSTTSLMENTWYREFMEKWNDGKDILRIENRYPLSGDIESRIDMSGFSVTADDKTMVVNPGSIQLRINRALDHATTTGRWEGLRAGGELSLSGLSITTDQSRVSSMTWTGKVEMAVDRISLIEMNGPGEIAGLKWNYGIGMNPEGDKLSLSSGLSAERAEVMGMSIENVILQAGFFQVHRKRYEEMMTLYLRIMKEMTQNMKDEPEGMDPEEIQRKMTALGMQMIEAYAKLLTKGLEFQISRLNAKLPQGDISGFLTLRLLKDMQPMEIMSFAVDPAMAFDYLELKADLTAPLVLVENNPVFMSPPMPGMTTSLFLARGDKATCFIETRGRALYLNETEVPLPRN